jgi:hypothetical protein
MEDLNLMKNPKKRPAYRVSLLRLSRSKLLRDALSLRFGPVE